MKKVFIIICMLLLGFSAVKAYAEYERYDYGEVLEKQSFVGIAGGGAIPEEEHIDNGYYVGGNFAVGINDNFAVGAEVGHTSWPHEEQGADYGDVRATPFFGNLYLRYPYDSGENMFVLYAKAGIGVVFWDYDESAVLSGNAVTVDAGDELGIKLGGGLDYFITDNLALNFESAYVWSDADITIPAFGTYAATDVDANYWSINAGIKYYFEFGN